MTVYDTLLSVLPPLLNVSSNNHHVDIKIRKTSVCLKIYTVFKGILNGKGQVEAGVREGYEMRENEANVFPLR